MPSGSFDRLAPLDLNLAKAGNDAEAQSANPKYCLFELRGWLEYLLAFLEIRHSIPPIPLDITGQGENEYRINRLQQYQVPISDERIKDLHDVRFLSNKASHSAGNEHYLVNKYSTRALREAILIADWVYSVYGAKHDPAPDGPSDPEPVPLDVAVAGYEQKRPRPTGPKQIHGLYILLFIVLSILGVALWLYGIDEAMIAAKQWALLEIEGIPLIALLSAVCLFLIISYAYPPIIVIEAAAIVTMIVIDLFKNGELNIGIRRYVLFLAAIIITLVLADVKHKRLAFLFGVLVFGTLGLSHFFNNYDEAQRWLTTNTAGVAYHPTINALAPAPVVTPNSHSYFRTLGVTPENLRGNARAINLQELGGGCVDVYDDQMLFLTRDCPGEWHDLGNKSATYFAASGSDSVEVKYDLSW